MLIPLTRRQIKLIQESWIEIAYIPEEFSELFYERLFAINPELQVLFKRNMTMQGRKLVNMFGTAVDCLGKLGQMMPPLEAAGKRHVQYGVKSEHYLDACLALDRTLRELLGDKYNEEVEQAWDAFSKLVTAVMTTATDLEWSERAAS